MDSQGRVVGAGTVKDTDLDLLVMRLTPTGTPDTTFSGDGLLSLDVGDDDGLAVVTQADDKAVVAGTSAESTNLMALVRFNANSAWPALARSQGSPRRRPS